MAAKYIFVTGGVVSGLGKGITAASLGRLLIDRGLQVTVMKLDPYLNIDPGTMNPIQHGEVFVTDDGAETDLDLGHYERFMDVSNQKQLLHFGQCVLQRPFQRTQRRLRRTDRSDYSAHHQRNQTPDCAQRNGGH